MPPDGISPKDWNLKKGEHLCLQCVGFKLFIKTDFTALFCESQFPWLFFKFIVLGGAQQKSRPGYFYNKEGEKIVQHFVFQDGPDMGLAKGLKVIHFPSVQG